MTLPLFFFYVFSIIAVASAAMVIFSRNPVHSVLFLILTFVNTAGLFMLAGAEFLALILIVVYVGAVAVLFLFVTMMLDVDFAEMRQGLLQYAPIGIVVGVIMLLELLLVAGTFVVSPNIAGSTVVEDDVVLAGQVGVAGHIRIGKGVVATAQTGIPNSTDAGTMVSGYPAIANRDWLKSSAVFRNLPALKKRVAELEQHVAHLEEKLKACRPSED